MARRVATARALVALVALVALAACAGEGGARGWPTVTVETLDAQFPRQVDSRDLLSDRPTVVTVWAVACAPCRDELPALQALLDDSEMTVGVVGVNNGDRPAEARAFLDELGVFFPMYRDPEARLTSALGVVSLPATMIVLPDGTLGWQHLGAVSIDEVRRQLAPYLPPGQSSSGRPIDG